MLTIWMRDTLTPTENLIESLLIEESVERLERNYQLANFYLAQGDLQNAQGVFTNLTQSYDLSNAQQEEFDKLEQLLGIKIDMINTGKSWHELSTEQNDLLSLFSLDSTSAAGMQSRAVLSYRDMVDFGLPIPSKEGDNRDISPISIYSETFKAFPEKVNDHFIIEYALASYEDIHEVEIAIYNSQGSSVLDFLIVTRANQFLVVPKEWKDDVYWAIKMVNGKESARERIVINKEGLIINKSVPDEIIEERLQIFPNPAGNYFFVKTNYTGKLIMEIRNVLGVKIMAVDINDPLTKISSESWSSGIYFINLLNNDGLVASQKLIIK